MTTNTTTSVRRRLWVAGTTLTGLAIATAAAIGLHTADAVATNAPAAAPAVPVSVATVQRTDVAQWDEFSGRLEAVDRVDVRSRVAGAVLSVHFREGALVQRGDLLVTIDPAPYAADVDRSEAQLAAAQARVAYASSEGQRARRLWDERAIAQRELDERLNAQREAEANLASAQAELRRARLNLDYTQVRAPVAGRVGRLEVTAGNLVAAGPGAPVLTTLVSVSPIYASFDADEQTVTRALRELKSLDKGGASLRTSIERIPVQMATAGSGDATRDGRLQLVDNQVDAKSGTVRVRAQFDNVDGALMPGQFARLRLGRAQNTAALLVSERAVGTDQNKKFVFVVGADDRTAYREVTLGASIDGQRIVTSGLEPGERIVVNGLQRVRPGVLVKPEPVAMAGTAAARHTAQADAAPRPDAAKPARADKTTKT